MCIEALFLSGGVGVSDGFLCLCEADPSVGFVGQELGKGGAALEGECKVLLGESVSSSIEQKARVFGVFGE